MRSLSKQSFYNMINKINLAILQRKTTVVIKTTTYRLTNFHLNLLKLLCKECFIAKCFYNPISQQLYIVLAYNSIGSPVFRKIAPVRFNNRRVVFSYHQLLYICLKHFEASFTLVLYNSNLRRFMMARDALDLGVGGVVILRIT